MSYEIKSLNECLRRLIDLCSHEVPTLLFLSGGSSLNLVNEFSKKYKGSLSHITMGFIDERFDREYSNYTQLMKQFPDVIPKTQQLGAIWIDTRPHKKDQYEMADWYEQTLLSLNYQRLIIVLGMGIDGHIAGIFPDEARVFYDRFVNTQRMVVGYEAKNEFPHRFTATFPVLEKADTILVRISGREKAKALHQALHGSMPLHICPASFFSISLKHCEIYTDILFESDM
ncbi:MAG: 6-phosphogluconolactonase [Patescibacteria group bacterium]|nr:6-phosphogluconolactonase [Patescibacteria group bacterium]